MSVIENRSTRLTPLDRRKDLLPWRCAHEFSHCYLYWAPVSQFPMGATERPWLLDFLTLFAQRIEQTRKAFANTFVDVRTVTEDEILRENFLNTAMEFKPLLGFSRAPGKQIPKGTVSQEDLDALVRSSRKGKKPDIYRFFPTYCYWFVNGSGERQRDLFFGNGGMTLLFMQADPKTAPSPQLAQLLPHVMRLKMLQPLREKIDIEKFVMQPSPLAGDFLPKSKTVFGDGMKRDLNFRGLPYIIPRLTAGDYFEADLTTIETWFSVFQIYLRECPQEGGLLLASKDNLEEDLLSVLDRMRGKNQNYPEWM